MDSPKLSRSWETKKIQDNENFDFKWRNKIRSYHVPEVLGKLYGSLYNYSVFISLQPSILTWTPTDIQSTQPRPYTLRLCHCCNVPPTQEVLLGLKSKHTHINTHTLWTRLLAQACYYRTFGEISSINIVLAYDWKAHRVTCWDY